MNIILFTRRRGHLHQISLGQPVIALPVMLLVVLMLGGIFGAGYQYAVSHGAASPDAQARTWQARLAEQEEEIRRATREAEENVQALSMRLGQLQAQVVRLEALGERLASMAELDDGEFDFARRPALGGPTEGEDDFGQYSAEFSEALAQLASRIDYRGRQLVVLEDIMRSSSLQDQVMPAGRPVTSGWISSGYGVRTDPFTGRRTRHFGTDFAARTGTPIKAVADGVVTWSGKRHGYGYMVEINHGNGYRTRYAHNDVNHVEVGDTVRRGDLIADVGQTGRATGPHLHFEVLHNGRAVDPMEFVRAGQ